MSRYLEDFVVGERWTSRTAVLSQEDIVRFAVENDPQPIHVDPERAGQGRFGSVISSGWQLAALSFRLFVESGGYGDTPVVGLGVEELRWRKPVRPGDRLRVTREVVSAERSRSRPEFGIIRTRVTMRNHNDEEVMTLVTVGQIKTRSPQGTPDRRQ